MAADTIHNELRLRVQIHRLTAAAPEQSLDALNTRVYRDLFLTPRSDPWLGLVPPALSAIEGDGIVLRVGAAASNTSRRSWAYHTLA